MKNERIYVVIVLPQVGIAIREVAAGKKYVYDEFQETPARFFAQRARTQRTVTHRVTLFGSKSLPRPLRQERTKTQEPFFGNLSNFT